MQQTYKFLFVGDVMEILGISKSKAYEIIRKMNKELEAEGYQSWRAHASHGDCRALIEKYDRLYNSIFERSDTDHV